MLRIELFRWITAPYRYCWYTSQRSERIPHLLSSVASKCWYSPRGISRSFPFSLSLCLSLAGAWPKLFWCTHFANVSVRMMLNDDKLSQHDDTSLSIVMALRRCSTTCITHRLHSQPAHYIDWFHSSRPKLWVCVFDAERWTISQPCVYNQRNGWRCTRACTLVHVMNAIRSIGGDKQTRKKKGEKNSWDEKLHVNKCTRVEPYGVCVCVCARAMPPMAIECRRIKYK